MKKCAKKSAAKDKVELFRTGGGTFEGCVTDIDAKVLALLGNTATPLYNAYDSDAVFCLPSIHVI